jgi:hypothetical protein
LKPKYFGWALLPVFCWASLCFSADYFVANQHPCNDSWAGSASQPWCTIQHAADILQAGDTVFVKEGNYPETVKFRHSGSAQAGFIVFRNYQDDIVTLNSGSFNGWNRSYIKIVGFRIQNPPREHPGIEFSGDGGYVEVRNNEVTGCQNSDAAAVRFGGTLHHFIIDGNHVHHNNTGTQEAVRVHMRTHDFEVTNNKVHHNSNIGIDVVGWSIYGKPFRGLIRGNIIHENSLSTPSSAGIYLDCPNEIVVESNISWGNQRGFELGCEPTGDHSTGNVIRYNIAYGNIRSGIQIGGYRGGQVHDCEVHNNVFYCNGGPEIGFDRTPGFNIKIYNNIIFNPKAALIRGAGDQITFQYNCYVGKGAIGASSITADPLFRDRARHDFRLMKGSPCIDAGSPLTPKGRDFSGTPVPLDGNKDSVRQADIGAFEYTDEAE